ncbi:MAG: hypothetical protein D6717_07150 [Gammaproteobacteria bacterium]|nr:MAG: hypothetical protein D6717_07150 [Gammaproteobacteria bacterium]
MSTEDPASLRQLGRDGRAAWRLLGPLDSCPVHFEFPGLFEQRPVLWDAWLWPRSAWQGAWPCPASCTQFMRIGPEQDGRRRIELVLDLDTIDERRLLMTCIMVRKYRRLREGVICFHGRNST